MSERTPSVHPASRVVKRQNVVGSTASRARAGVVISPHDNIRTVLIGMPTHIRVQYNGTSIAWARSNLKPIYATTRQHLHRDLVEMGLVAANVNEDAMSLSALFPSETAWLRVPPSQWQALVRSGQIQALKVEYRPQPEVREEEPGVEPSVDPGAQPE